MFRMIETILLANEMSVHLGTLIKRIQRNIHKLTIMPKDEMAELQAIMMELEKFYKAYNIALLSLNERFFTADFQIPAPESIEQFENELYELSVSLNENYKNFIFRLDALLSFHYVHDKLWVKLEVALSDAFTYALYNENIGINKMLAITQKIKMLKDHQNSIFYNWKLLTSRLVEQDYTTLPEQQHEPGMNLYLKSLSEALTMHCNKIIATLLFYYHPDYHMEICKQTYKLMKEPLLPFCGGNFFLQPDEDFKIVFKFIKKNHDFFIAVYRDFDRFQNWCENREDWITTYSNVLKKNIHGTDQLKAFGEALKQYADTRQDRLLAKFLLHRYNKNHLVRDLRELIDDFDFQNVCNEWQEDASLDNNEIEIASRCLKL